MPAAHFVIAFSLFATALFSGVAHAQQAPVALIDRVSSEVLDAIKANRSIRSGDVQETTALVDAKVMPHVNFARMTASAVGRYWRQATAEQRSQLQEEFKILLVRTYSGALSQVNDQQTIHLKPMRSNPEDTEVVVRTEVRGSGDPIQLDYRLEKVGGDWKIYDVNVLGVWLVQNYRSSFASEISRGGVDGLIKSLVDRNKSTASKSS